MRTHHLRLALTGLGLAFVLPVTACDRTQGATPPAVQVAAATQADASAAEEPDKGQPPSAEGAAGQPQPGPTDGAAPTPRTDLPPTGTDSEPPAPYTAADAGRELISFLSLAQGKPLKLESATEDKSLFKVSYVSADAAGVKGRAWLTRDGRWITHNLVDIETRTEHLLTYKRWTDCLRANNVRIFINPEEETSRAQFKELGPFASRLTIDCAAKRKPWCQKLGQTVWPVVMWKDKAEIGLRKQAWLSRNVGCKLELFQEVAAPAQVDERDLGARVLRLHQLATDDPLSLLSVRRDGEIYVITLARGLTKPELISATATRDGVFLMQTPLDITAEQEKIAVRRGFLTCLREHDVTFLVRNSDRDSLQWLASVGPEARSIAVDCDHDQGKAFCARHKVTVVPALMIGKQRVDGATTAADLEAMTGCKP